MSFQETTDSEDYDECYDECDSYNVKIHQSVSCVNVTEYGIPLSVELSESLLGCKTLVNKQTSNRFAKSAEIFLRFDSNNDTAERDTIRYVDRTFDNECIELQYENQFDGPSEVVNSNAQAIHRGNNSFDYEEMFVEGIL